MKYTKYIVLPLLVFVLVGQGCSSDSAPSDGGVFWTEDAGASWIQVATLPTVQGLSTIANVNVTSLEVDPSDHNVIYAGTMANGLFYSYDNGNSWMRPKGEEATTGWVVDVEVDPNDVCTIYVVKTDRILKTEDCNRTYVTLAPENREDEQFTSFSLDWFNPSVLWAGNSVGEVMKSMDGGVSWAIMHYTRSDIRGVEVSNADSRIIFVGTRNQGLWRSTDSGATWEEFEDDFKREYRNWDNVYGFTQARDGSRVIMNTEYGLFTSADRGATWEPIAEQPSREKERIWSMAIHPANPDVISYGTVGSLYVSTNGGGSWSISDMPTTRAPMALIVHPSNTTRLYAGFAVFEN